MPGCDAVISLFGRCYVAVIYRSVVHVTEQKNNVFSGLKRGTVGGMRDSD